MAIAKMTEQDYFLKNVTMLCDTREKNNSDLLRVFEHAGAKIKKKTFKSADYSFEIDGKDYSDEWLAERKGGVFELYDNVMARNSDSHGSERNNLEKECKRIKEAGINEFILFIQGMKNLGEVRHFLVPMASNQGKNGGQHIYNTLMAWQCNNRYGFKIVCRITQKEIAGEMLTFAYHYWRNKMKSEYGDNFLKVLCSTKEG